MQPLKEYMQNSSLHGLKYMCQEERHWSERLFWLVCICVSLYGTTSIVQATWSSFQTEAISFVVDTNYPEWNTTFPALTVCEQESYDQTEDYLRRRNMSEGEDIDDLMIMYQEIVFFTGLCDQCSNEESGLPWPVSDEFFNLTTDFLKTCEQLLLNCSWNGQPFDCCSKFHPIRTELGYCYAINSLQTINPPNSADMLIANRKSSGVGSLEFCATGTVKVHQHAPQDVPTPTSVSDSDSWFAVQDGEVVERIFSVRRGVMDLGPGDVQRAGGARLVRGAAPVSVLGRERAVFCLSLLQLLHLPDVNVPVCGHKGMSCISANQGLIKEMRASVDEAKNSFECACLPSCTDPSLNVVWAPIANQQEGLEYAVVKVQMSSLPTERLLRIVVRGKLDLVVAAGGTVGLFLGASLLSSIEIIYYLLIRPISNKLTQPTRRHRNHIQTSR